MVDVTHNLPADFRVTPLPDGVRYELPRPPLAMYRLAGAGAMLFGLLTLGFCAVWMWHASGLLFDGEGEFQGSPIGADG